MYQYAYFTLSLFLFGLWLLCFLLFKKERQAIFWTALIFAPAGPFSEFWHLQDYWEPVFIFEVSIGPWRWGIEDYISSFSISGIAAGIFEFFARRKGLPELPRFNLKAFIKLHAWGLLGLGMMALFASGIGFCSIHSIMLTLLLCGTMLLRGNKHLISLASVLSLMFGTLYWLILFAFLVPLYPGLIPAIWKLETTWGLLIGGIPIEEFLWACCIMLFGGPVLRLNSSFSNKS